MTKKKHLEKIGYILYFEANIGDSMEKVFVTEYDSIEEAEIKKSVINRGEGNIDIIVGTAHHYKRVDGEDYIAIQPRGRDASERFFYTDMVCANEVARVCERIVTEVKQKAESSHG